MNCCTELFDPKTLSMIEKIKKHIIEKPFNRHGMFNLKSLSISYFSPNVSNFSVEGEDSLHVFKENKELIEDFSQGVIFRNCELSVEIKIRGKKIQYLISYEDFLSFLENFKGIKENLDYNYNLTTIDSDSEHEGVKILKNSNEIKKRYSLIERKLKNYFKSIEINGKSLNEIDPNTLLKDCSGSNLKEEDSGFLLNSKETRNNTPFFKNQRVYIKRYKEDEDKPIQKELYLNQHTNIKNDFFEEISPRKDNVKGIYKDGNLQGKEII